MSLSFSKKSKCQGCVALCSSKENYSCDLGFKLTFGTENGNPWKPQPLEKCYKPKSTPELREAKKLLKEKVSEA